MTNFGFIKVREFLNTHIDISDEEYLHFISIAKEKTFKKGDFLLRANKPTEKLFYVLSGFMRGYRIINGEDVTHHFFFDNWVATDLESYLTGRQGTLYIEALIDTTVLEFDKTTLYEYYASYPKFEKIRSIQAEDAYLRMVDRLRDFQCTDLRMRYHKLISQDPQLFNKVPQKHIASYLGVAPQSLSRIKKEVLKQ